MRPFRGRTARSQEVQEGLQRNSISRMPFRCDCSACVSRAVAANERKITARPEAFLDHTRINKLALGISINIRIVANLFKAIDPNGLGLPHYLARDRTLHRNQRSLAE